MFIVMLFVLFLNLNGFQAGSLPKYIKPCPKKDFNQCATKAAQEAIPKLLNGDRKLGLPSFQPFKISEVNLISSNNLKFSLTNITVFGLESVEIRDFSINQQERRIGFTSFNKLINILANYVIDGRILFIPLQGSGPCKLSFVNGTYNYSYVYDIEQRNGKQYGKINKSLSSFNYEIQKAIFNLEGLFNGDVQLGEQTNQLINANWESLNEEMKPSIIDALSAIFESIGNMVHKKIPLNELVPN